MFRIWEKNIGGVPMISNQILQNTIDGVTGITKIELSVVDTEGNVLAETSKGIAEYGTLIHSFVESPADSQDLSGYQFFKVYDESHLEYIVIAKGDAENVYMIGKHYLLCYIFLCIF